MNRFDVDKVVNFSSRNAFRSDDHGNQQTTGTQVARSDSRYVYVGGYLNLILINRILIHPTLGTPLLISPVLIDRVLTPDRENTGQQGHCHQKYPNHRPLHVTSHVRYYTTQPQLGCRGG